MVTPTGRLETSRPEFQHPYGEGSSEGFPILVGHDFSSLEQRVLYYQHGYISLNQPTIISIDGTIYNESEVTTMRSNHTAFSRSIAIFTAIQAALSQGVSYANALLQTGAEMYQSRGKGGKARKTCRTNWHRSSNHYPWSSEKQANRRNTYMKLMPNGHWIMQTVKRGHEVTTYNTNFNNEIN